VRRLDQEGEEGVPPLRDAREAMTPGFAPLTRPRGFTGERWGEVRRAWINAPSTEARKALAVEYGLGESTLWQWAKRCGWPRGYRNTGGG
jgi:hypothetical protein